MRRIDEWQAAWVEVRAPGFGPDEWIRELQAISLRPGEDCGHVARHLEIERGKKRGDIRVVPIDR